MEPHSYRLRICSVDMKRKKIALWAWEACFSRAQERGLLNSKVQRPWGQAGQGELAGLALALLSLLLRDPLE